MKHGTDPPSSDRHLVWENLESEFLLDAKIFQVRTVHRRAPDGRAAPFVSVDSSDWVTVIAELPSESETPHFLIVRQYRHGTESVELEFPAGAVDPGEDSLTAARRELLEETGYEAGDWSCIGTVSPNPAFMTNTIRTYLARVLKKVSGQNLDENELMDVHTVSFDELSRKVGEKPYASAITSQAWFFYLKATGRI